MPNTDFANDHAQDALCSSNGRLALPAEGPAAAQGLNILLVEDVDECRFKPDMAIVDLRMPRKDGFALLLELRARVTVDFPSVVLTSSRNGADVYRSEKRGATTFITKPNSLEKLTSVLDKVVASVERP